MSSYVERYRVARRLPRPPPLPTPQDDRDTKRTGRRAKPSASRQRLDTKQRARSRLYNLALDVNELRREIHQLTLHRSMLYSRALSTARDADGSAFRRAQEYFRVFSRGYRVLDSIPPAFIEAIADEQLTLGVTGLGRDMLLEQWRLYTSYFAIR